MAGGFAIPSISLSGVVRGARARHDELREQDWAVERANRERYVNHLSKLMDSAADGETVQWLGEEIARVDTLPRDKPFKPRSIPPPSSMKPQPQQQQGQQGGAAGTSGQAPATPPFDFRQVMQAVTGAGAGAAGAAQTGQPAAAPPGLAPNAQPPMPPGLPQAAALGGAPIGSGPGLGPFTGATPQLAPQRAPQPASPPMPKVVTPPGRSVPEASPMVGSLPGATPPAMQLAGAGAGAAQSTAPATSVVPAVPAMPAVPDVTPTSRFMGIRERAELPYELMEKYGVTRAGRLRDDTPGKQHAVTVRDIVSAARAGLEIVEDPESPSGFSTIPKEVSELSELQRSKLGLDKLRAASIAHRDKLADLQLSLQRERMQFAREKNAVTMARWVGDKTIQVKKNYEQSVKFFESALDDMSQVLAMLDQGTGPAHYAAIVKMVHSLDQTAAREGEVEVYRGAASLYDRLDQIFKRATEGDLLNGTTSEQMRDAIVASVNALRPRKAEIDARYGYLADQIGLDRVSVGVAPVPAVGAGGGGRTPTPATPALPAAASGAQPPPASGRMRKQQRHPRTGATRTVYSDDGGVTWHP